MKSAQTEITITIDLSDLPRVSDSRLALYWHVAQANPADGFTEREPGEIVAKLGYEIIRRWMGQVPPELYRHQERGYWWKNLIRFAKHVDGQWIPRTADDNPPAPVPGETP